jgi:hypothetical protein
VGGWLAVVQPLIGCILWISLSISRMLAFQTGDAPPDSLPQGHWQLCAGFTMYILLGTFQQCVT